MSRKRSSSVQTTKVETRNLNVQGIEGIAVVGNEGETTVQLEITDDGAIEKMAQVAITALERAGKAEQQALLFSERAGRAALEFAYDAGRPEADVQKTMTIAAALMAGGVLVYGITRAMR